MAKKLPSLQPRNDVIKNALKGLVPELADSHLAIDFYCECSQNDCADRISLEVAQYSQIHRDPTHIMVRPPHAPAAAQVVERHPDYWVIEKTSRAR